MTDYTHFLFSFIAITVALACGLTPTPTPSPALTPAQFAIDPTSASSGLSELKSYRTHLAVDFTGKRNGEAVAGHIEALTEITRQPPALHHYLRIDGHLPKAKIPTGVSEFFQINDQMYLKKAGDTLWSQFTGQNISPFPNLVEYLSPTSAISATQFYQDELAALEWTEENTILFKEKARLTFVKEGQILTILITSIDGDKIKVVLDISP